MNEEGRNDLVVAAVPLWFSVQSDSNFHCLPFVVLENHLPSARYQHMQATYPLPGTSTCTQPTLCQVPAHGAVAVAHEHHCLHVAIAGVPPTAEQLSATAVEVVCLGQRREREREREGEGER